MAWARKGTLKVPPGVAATDSRALLVPAGALAVNRRVTTHASWGPRGRPAQVSVRMDQEAAASPATDVAKQPAAFSPELLTVTRAVGMAPSTRSPRSTGDGAAVSAAAAAPAPVSSAEAAAPDSV